MGEDALCPACQHQVFQAEAVIAGGLLIRNKFCKTNVTLGRKLGKCEVYGKFTQSSFAFALFEMICYTYLIVGWSHEGDMGYWCEISGVTGAIHRPLCPQHPNTLPSHHQKYF